MILSGNADAEVVCVECSMYLQVEKDTDTDTDRQRDRRRETQIERVCERIFRDDFWSVLE